MTWLKHNWRGILARLPLPTLALAASWGVGSFAALFVPRGIAIIQATAFELTYIGLAIVDVPERARRQRARNISLSAVAVSVVYNSAAGYFHRNPAALIGLSFYEELMLAIAHGAPLAIVAFLVADLLFHTRRSDRPRQLRAMVRRLVRQLRAARAELAPMGVMLATARAELATALQTIAQYTAQLTQADEHARDWSATVTRLETELADAREHAANNDADRARIRADVTRIEADLAEARAQGREATHAAMALRAELDQAQAELANRRASIPPSRATVVAYARERMRAGASRSEVAAELGYSESTLRGWMDTATNGHAVAVE